MNGSLISITSYMNGVCFRVSGGTSVPKLPPSYPPPPPPSLDDGTIFFIIIIIFFHFHPFGDSNDTFMQLLSINPQSTLVYGLGFCF